MIPTKRIWTIAAILFAACLLATCAKADALGDYIAARPADAPAGVHAILMELRATETVSTETNAVPARVRSAAEKQIITDSVPLLTTKDAWRASDDKEAHLDAAIRAKLDGGATIGESRRIIAILTTRAAIAREGRTLSGDDGDEPQPPIISAVQGPPLWQRLGLPALPEPNQIRDALRAGK